MNDTGLGLELLETGHSWSFHRKLVVRVGRALDNDVAIAHPAVSRHHLELKRSGRGWTLTNLGINQTYWQGHPVHHSRLPSTLVLELAPDGPHLKVQQLPPCTHEDNPPTNLFCEHCGEPLRSVGQVADYRLVRPLGMGGMATTYLAWHPNGGTCVVKEMNPELFDNPKARELFEREAELQARLIHPGIPKLFTHLHLGDRAYLVMEMIHGLDLEQWVLTRGPVSSPQAIAWLIALCDILQYLHSQRPPVMHRDIKPANLLVRERDQHLFLIDFGAVKELGRGAGTSIGAPSYSAPEQLLGKTVPQSDLYALGPTFLFLVTGADPQRFFRWQNGRRTLNPTTLKGLFPPVLPVLQKLTAPLVGDRYPNAATVAAALRACLPPSAEILV
ncbi:MAG TPA: serine/threonine protein kinase [Cyanobacteria bacterium UBA8156]|jgi:serine/threonine-protein kinase|nr:serine/threonine protein kinase [Cyanobacteria bacterium UBA8156]